MFRPIPALLRIVIGLAVVGVLSLPALKYREERGAAEPIRIGVLHSMTGTMAASEGPLVDAVRLAVEEVNAQMAGAPRRRSSTQRSAQAA